MTTVKASCHSMAIEKASAKSARINQNIHMRVDRSELSMTHLMTLRSKSARSKMSARAKDVEVKGKRLSLMESYIPTLICELTPVAVIEVHVA